MVDCSLFPTSSQLAAQTDASLSDALAPLRKYPFTTLEAIEEALSEKVESWSYAPAFCDGWATNDQDCEKLRAWVPIEVRIHCRGRNGSPSFLGECLMVLFAKCKESGECPCGAACGLVD
jgi:hypothetical protein